MAVKNTSKQHHSAEMKIAEVEAQKKRLKNLIVLGKERGYLTYAEINDHLPDDMYQPTVHQEKKMREAPLLRGFIITEISEILRFARRSSSRTPMSW